MTTQDTTPSIPIKPARTPRPDHALQALYQQAREIERLHTKLLDEVERAAQRLTQRAARLKYERTTCGEIAPSLVMDGHVSCARSLVRDDLLWLQDIPAELDSAEAALATQMAIVGAALGLTREQLFSLINANVKGS